MANSYDIGDVARLSTTTVFTDADTGDPFDPDKVIFKYKPPNGATVTRTYPDDNPATITKNDVGDYYTDIALTVAGTWYYRIEGTDSATPANPLGADEGNLEVVASNV